MAEYVSQESQEEKPKGIIQSKKKGFSKLHTYAQLGNDILGSSDVPDPNNPIQAMWNQPDKSTSSTMIQLMQSSNQDPISREMIQLMQANGGINASPTASTSHVTGLPNKLKNNMEQLSGFSMDDVKVHHNAQQPAQLQAHAFAQGNEIHLGPGQEQHLPHEAWHVVQQKQGRVKPTTQLKGKTPINDDSKLEKEADQMGEKAMQLNSDSTNIPLKNNQHTQIVQRKIDYTKQSDTTDNASNFDEMLKFLKTMFPNVDEDTLVAELNHEETNEKRLITPYAFFRGLLDKYSQLEELSEEKMDGPRMPNRLQDVKDFSNTQRTMLIGSVGTNAFPPMRNIKKSQKGGAGVGKHAEKIFVDKIEELEIDLESNPRVIITINNSPCNAKCAKMLARWVKKNKLTNVTIYFANPYGFNKNVKKNEDEFVLARRTLEKAGIELKDFDPTLYINEANKKSLYKGRKSKKLSALGEAFKSLKDRRLEAKTQKKTYSSEEEESDNEHVLETPELSDNEAENLDDQSNEVLCIEVGSSEELLDYSDSEEEVEEDLSKKRGAHRGSRRRKKRRVRRRIESKIEEEDGNEADIEDFEDFEEEYDEYDSFESESDHEDQQLPGKLHNVSGKGMDCLIRAILLSTTGNVDEQYVEQIRQYLIDQQVTQRGSMLDLVGDAGGILISFLINNKLLNANRGINVYCQSRRGIVCHKVLDGPNPINLWLYNSHFKAIF